MGTVPHHQARSEAFLNRARDAIAAGDATEAAHALRRAVSHAVTALAVHTGLRHNTTRRLEIALHNLIAGGQLSRSHLKTFRQAYSLPAHLSSPSHNPPILSPSKDHGKPAEPRPNPAPTVIAKTEATWQIRNGINNLSVHPEPLVIARSEATWQSRSGSRRRSHQSYPARLTRHPNPDPIITLRRMRRRVAALVNAAAAIIAGQPKTVRVPKRWLRGLPPRESQPTPPTILSVQDILDLPNYRDIVAAYDLIGAPFAKRPDPHGMYEHGRTPRPCSCHPETRAMPSQDETTITLSPLWRRALEHAFGIPIPQTLPA